MVPSGNKILENRESYRPLGLIGLFANPIVILCMSLADVGETAHGYE